MGTKVKQLRELFDQVAARSSMDIEREERMGRGGCLNSMLPLRVFPEGSDTSSPGREALLSAAAHRVYLQSMFEEARSLLLPGGGNQAIKCGESVRWIDAQNGNEYCGTVEHIRRGKQFTARLGTWRMPALARRPLLAFGTQGQDYEREVVSVLTDVLPRMIWTKSQTWNKVRESYHRLASSHESLF